MTPESSFGLYPYDPKPTACPPNWERNEYDEEMFDSWEDAKEFERLADK